MADGGRRTTAFPIRSDWIGNDSLSEIRLLPSAILLDVD